MKQSVAHRICEMSQLPVIAVSLMAVFVLRSRSRWLHPNLHVHILQVPCLVRRHKLVWGLCRLLVHQMHHLLRLAGFSIESAWLSLFHRSIAIVNHQLFLLPTPPPTVDGNANCKNQGQGQKGRQDDQPFWNLRFPYRTRGCVCLTFLTPT